MTVDELGVLEQFADNLRVARARSRLSQEELARMAGVYRSQISLFESGQRAPRITTFVRLCGALGHSPNGMLKGITWEPGIVHPGGFRVQSEGS